MKVDEDDIEMMKKRNKEDEERRKKLDSDSALLDTIDLKESIVFFLLIYQTIKIKKNQRDLRWTIYDVVSPEIFWVNPLTEKTKTCNENEFKRLKEIFY